MAQSDFEELARLQELGLSIEDIASAGVATIEDLSKTNATVAVSIAIVRALTAMRRPHCR